jgi:hypothetical protein
MAKGTTLGLIALLLAIGGIGLGGSAIILTLNNSGIHTRTYTAEYTSSYTSAGEDVWYDITDMSITFEVEFGEEVYFSFTCYASLTPTSAICRMNFRLVIDTVAADDSVVVVGGTSMPTNTLFSVALQYFQTDLSVGSHTVVVQTMRECGGYIDNCYLLVQAYIP